MSKNRSDCICTFRKAPAGVEFDRPVLVWNPRCAFHTGPDQGYGWDNNGIPVTRAGNIFANLVTGFIIGCVLVSIGAVILKAVL